MFEGRKLSIATKHKKEEVIAPVLENALGVKCFVPKDLDTDIFGTFSGEVERKNDPVTTARNKCLNAMKLNNCDLAIASEGSFGMHPFVFFTYADEEIVLFMDKKNDLEIVSKELSTDTNFNGQKINTEKQLMDFAERAKFPTHGLICKNSQ